MMIKTFLASISIFFSLLLIYITILNYKKKIITIIEATIWNFIWVGIIFLSIRPKIVDQYFIDSYNIDIFYIISVLSIISLLIFGYFNMLKIKIMEKKIDTIIRAESLKKVLDKIEN